MRRHDAATKARAVAALKSGRSLADVGREFEVNPMTVARWRDLAAVLPPPIEKRVEKILAETQPEAPLEETFDSLAATRRMLRNAQELAAQAQREGNFTAAQRAMRDAAELMRLVARLEKIETADEDVLRISRAEIAQARESVFARLETLRARGLRCPQCDRELSIEWGNSHAEKS
jgi:transposase-like protein